MLSSVLDILVMHCGSDSADQSKVSLVQYSNLINKRPVNIAQFRLTMSFSLRFLNYYHYHFICCCRLYAYLQCTSLCKSNNKIEFFSLQVMFIVLRGLGGVVVIDAAIGAHGKSRPRFKPGTLLHCCSDLGQVVNLSLSVA